MCMEIEDKNFGVDHWKVSEVIKLLESYKEKYGDVDVCSLDTEMGPNTLHSWFEIGYSEKFNSVYFY